MYCSSKHHSLNINMTETFFEVNKCFLKKKTNKDKVWSIFLAILELCAFYMEYREVKFTATNVRSQIDAKYFMKTQLLRFYKDTAKGSSLPLIKITTKSTYFLPAKKQIPILCIKFQTNKIQKIWKPYIYHRVVKNLQIARTFLENVNKEATLFFKNKLFSSSQ